MKKKVAEELLGRVADSFAERKLHVKGHVLFEVPIGDVLCGLCLESSGFSATVFTPTAFVQPMFEKNSSLVLSLGDRFLGNWSSTDDGIVDRLIQQMDAVGMPVWGKFGSVEQLASLPRDPRRPLRSVTTGYALSLCNEYPEAIRMLLSANEDLTRIYGDQMKADISFWPSVVHSEVIDMVEKLRTRPEVALATLRDWRQFTLESLELTSFAG